jgi:integrase
VAQQQKQRFADYATSLLERKLKKGEIKSARGFERWRYTLKHLIGGTEEVTGFGELFVDQIRPTHVEQWAAGIGELISTQKYAPTTANGWLHILRHILKEAKRELQLTAANPADGVKGFDTSEHETYTEEEPNALTAQEASEFLKCMREEFPGTYAMTYLALATGLRPSHMRPLRRSGPTPDIIWEENMILVRRSHTLNKIMNTTKTKRRQRIAVPVDVMKILKWHVETQLTTPEQKTSELLFAAEDGGCRSENFLTKSFAKVGLMIGLKKKVTPKGMRRTFNDLTRLADVEGLVTRSISGHQTDRMRELYSTVHPSEQRNSIGKVLRLVDSADSSGLPGGLQTPQSGLH